MNNFNKLVKQILEETAIGTANHAGLATQEVDPMKIMWSIENGLSNSRLTPMWDRGIDNTLKAIITALVKEAAEIAVLVRAVDGKIPPQATLLEVICSVQTETGCTREQADKVLSYLIATNSD